MEKDNNLSEFMKTAYANGDVKDLNEAFEKYPPENEWHKGKLRVILKVKRYRKAYIKAMKHTMK